MKHQFLKVFVLLLVTMLHITCVLGESELLVEEDTCLSGDKSPCSFPSFCLSENDGKHQCIKNCYYPRYSRSYVNNRRICKDVNECDYINCGQNRECVNLIGGYKCKRVNCSKGFELKNKRCIDIDECVKGDVCGNGRCFNYWGSFYCYCNKGYQPDGQKSKKCVDVNECESKFRRCSYECMNTEGSYKCKCPPGYRSQGAYCYDLNECASDQRTCNVSQECFNTKGSFQCVNEICPKYMNRVGRNVCKKQQCHKDDTECHAVKTSSIKWKRYAFEQKQPARTFTFTYSLSGYGYQYRYQFSFAKGNEELLFSIRQLSQGRVQIINIKDLFGPKDIKLVFHADVVDQKDVLVNRFAYFLYFNMAEHDLTF